MSLPLEVVVLLTWFVAAAAAGLIAWSGPVDPVKARSSHLRPTPTSAGVGVIAATCLGAAALHARPEVAALLACAALLGLFGAADDLLDLGPLPKLAVQTAAALAVATMVAHVDYLPLWPGFAPEIGPFFGVAGSALFLLVLVNTANFMDGSDGLVSGWAAVTACIVVLLGAGPAGVDSVAWALLAANIGFLPWNLRRRVFQGDAGAFFSALTLGGLALLMAGRGATPYPVVFAALPLLVDVLLTLVVRVRRGARLGEAHREHLYQLWLQRTGRPHLALAWRVWLLTALCGGLGLVLDTLAPAWALPGLLATAAVLSAGWARVRGRLASALPRTSAAAAPRAGRPADGADTGTPPNR